MIRDYEIRRFGFGEGGGEGKIFEKSRKFSQMEAGRRQKCKQASGTRQEAGVRSIPLGP
jgi:hypothetical protein